VDTDTDGERERFRGPVRDAPLLIRLTRQERERLQAFALREDLRAGQAARRFINAALDIEGDGPRDGRAA